MDDLLRNLDVDRLCKASDGRLQSVLERQHRVVNALRWQCVYVTRCVGLFQARHTKTRKPLKVGVFGVGMVGRTVVDGLTIELGFARNDIMVYSRRHEICTEIEEEKGVKARNNVRELIEEFGARLLILCCNSAQLGDLAKELKPLLKPSTITLSLVLGVSQKKLSDLLGSRSVVRIHVNPSCIEFAKDDHEPALKDGSREFFCEPKEDGSTSATQLVRALIIQGSALGGSTIEELEPLAKALVLGNEREEEFANHARRILNNQTGN